MQIWSAEIIGLKTLYTSIKGLFPGLEKELEKLVNADDENMVLLYSRRCLEVIITDLCECELSRPRKTEPLKGIIDKLNREEKVPSHIIASMHSLNSLSTFGAHPKEFDPEQVKPVLNNLTTIIKWYLKYKETKTISKPQAEEEDKHEIKGSDDSTVQIQNPKKRLMLMLSGFLLTVVIVTVALFLFNIIGIGRQSKDPAKHKDSIAVLPVSNLTGNPENKPIAAGIHDALIGQLGQISSLVVKSRTSTLQFMDSKETIQQIAKKLDANNIVESSLVGSTDSLQIIVQLIEVFPVERHLWSATFDQDWNNIMSVYSDIVRRIASGIQIKLTPQEEKKISNVQQHNPDLVKAIYNGSYYMNQLTPEGFKMGLELFNDAMAIDPSDPLPYLGLALGYSNASHVSALSPDASDRAIAYAHQALELDPNLAEAYVVLAARSLYTDWDFVASEQYLKRAMDLNPSIAMAHYHYGWFWMLSNNVDEAIAEFKKSIEIDPIDAIYTCNLASLYGWIGRYEEALAEARKTLELDPDYPMGYMELGLAYAGMGMYNEAIETHKKGLAISPGFEPGLGIAYALSGQREKALEVAAGLEKINDKWYTYGIAEIYAALGDNDKAIYWIEEAYKRRQDFVPWFKYNVYFKPLSDDPPI